MNRTDFQQLADLRIDEALTLLGQGKFEGAYYLGGYAIECALKASIAKQINQHDFPDKQFVQKCYTHNLKDLMGVSSLEADLEFDATVDPILAGNWLTVRKWNEASRYDRKTQLEAESMCDAVSNLAHGVLSWIKQRW